MKKGSLMAPQEAEARGNMYRFLSTVYLRPPTKQLVRHIVAQDVPSQLASVFGEEAAAELKTFAASGQGQQDLSLLKQEYMDLFAVPTSRYVTPFEDVYRGAHSIDGKLQRGPLLGAYAVAVIKLYRQAGAELYRACRELPTHIGVEISFMSFLREREAAAMRRKGREALLVPEQTQGADATTYRSLQLRFLQEHLNVWFPDLSKAIQARAQCHFYRGWARITEVFLAREMGSLLAQFNAEEYAQA